MVAFDDLPGLTSTRQLLQRLLADGVQGVLIYGAEGAGQEDVAATLAKAWLCLNPTDRGACGDCKPCGAFAREANVDRLEIRPSGPSNWIRTNWIRDSGPEKMPITVQDFTRTLPLMSANKVVVIHDIDRLYPEAANSFLKMLEEPGPQVRYVLTTRAIGRVLPTVLSRCLTIPCEKVARPEGLDLIGQVFYEVPQYEYLREKPEVVRRLAEIAEELGAAPRVAALQFSERLREVSEGLSSREDSSRTKLAAGLEIFAVMVRVLYPERGDWLSQILEAHRRVVGNALGALVTDGMFMAMLR